MRHRVASILLVPLIVACGGDSNPPAEEARAMETGAAASGECELPAPFPAETPIVPGCFNVSDRSFGNTVVLIASTTESPEAALTFFEEELPARGWTIDRRETNPDGVESLYVAGHGIEAVIEVQPPSSEDAEAIGVNYLIL